MNSRAAFLGLALLATGLAAAIALELDTVGQPVEDVTGIVPIRHVPKAQPHVASEDPEDHTDDWVATALARPLFSRDRKPTPVEAKAGGTALAALPRLTGIVVGPFGRTAIFAGSEGARPIEVTEGKTLGAYTVQSIERGGVTVDGPQGVQQVVLGADAAARQAMAADIPRVPQVSPGQPPAVPGLPAGVQPGGVAPGLPVGLQRQNMLNLRNGVQFQRPLLGMQPPKPTPEGTD